MNFMETTPRKPRSSLAAHLAIVLTAVATLAAFGLADDEVTGGALVSDAYGFTLLFLAGGYYLVILPGLWNRSRGTALAPLMLPVFLALMIAYLYFVFRTYFVQPAATAATVFVQLAVMIWLSCRID